jgi:hypothetical protein
MGGSRSAVNENVKSEATSDLRESEHQKITGTRKRALLQIQRNTVPVINRVTGISFN